MYNYCAIQGRLTKDVVILNQNETTPERVNVGGSVACEDEQGKPYFFEFYFYAPRKLVEYLKKGQMVIISGTLKYRDRSDEEQSQRVYYINGYNIQLISSQKIDEAVLKYDLRPYAR